MTSCSCTRPACWRRSAWPRGLRLNHPEVVPLSPTQLLEFIRDGRTVAELMDLGRQFLGPRRRDARGSPISIEEVQVEGTFPDGTKLVTVHHPIAAQAGDRALALSRQLPAGRRRGGHGDRAGTPGRGARAP